MKTTSLMYNFLDTFSGKTGIQDLETLATEMETRESVKCDFCKTANATFFEPAEDPIHYGAETVSLCSKCYDEMIAEEEEGESE